MKRRSTILAALAVTAVAAATLTGCSSSGSASSGSDNITVWARDSESAFMGKLVDKFNATHDTKAKLTLVPAADYVQKFGTAAAGGNAPDVAAIDLVYVPYFASAGALSDISSDVDKLSYKNDMSKAHTAQGQHEGKTYSVPFTADVSVMFYNKDLFKQAGLDPNKPPTTMAEYQADAEKVTALGDGNYGTVFSGGCGGCNIFGLGPYVWANGGDVLNKNGTKSQLDSPEVTSMLQMYRDLWDKNAMPKLTQSDNGANAGSAFQSGKVAFKNDGTFFVNGLKDVGFDWGVAPIPGSKAGDTASFAGGDNLAIPSGSKNKDGAWQFLKWATGEQAQTVLADGGVMPTRMDLLSKVYEPRDPRYKVFADALAVGHCPYSVVENELINDPNGFWNTMIQEAVFGSSSIEAAQKKAQKASQALLDKQN